MILGWTAAPSGDSAHPLDTALLSPTTSYMVRLFLRQPALNKLTRGRRWRHDAWRGCGLRRARGQRRIS